MNTSSRQLISRLFRLFLVTWTLVTLSILSACGASSDAGSSSDPSPVPTTDPTTDPPAEPPPVDVPERFVDVSESGSGQNVVFESGLGNDWTSWKMVISEVAERAHTFAYSRPGYGKSEPSPEPRDAAQIVEDLRTLLASRSVAPPYVLVGHSFGGTYMELFAKAHPEEVSALVLVDPRHRDFTTACEEAGFEGCLPPDSVVATLPQVQQDEIEAFAKSSDEIHAAGVFGMYPVRVLTSTVHGFDPALEVIWESLLGSLADEAADGEQVIYPGAGHLLQLQRAHEVSEVILGFVSTTEG